MFDLLSNYQKTNCYQGSYKGTFVLTTTLLSTMLINSCISINYIYSQIPLHEIISFLYELYILQYHYVRCSAIILSSPISVS
jgi:hypothetical protein